MQILKVQSGQEAPWCVDKDPLELAYGSLMSAYTLSHVCKLCLYIKALCEYIFVFQRVLSNIQIYEGFVNFLDNFPKNSKLC